MNVNEFMRRNKINVIAVIIATAGVLCFPQILNLKENVLGYTNSIFSVVIWILCIYIINLSLHGIDFHDIRSLWLAGILSFLFTVSMLFGTRLDAVGNVNFKDWRLWASMPVLTCFFAVLIRRLWSFLEEIEKKKEGYAKPVKMPRLPAVIARHEDLATYLFLLICWFPVMLAVYPGFFVYDAQDEYVQVAARAFSTHHPLVHVLLLGGIICAVHKFTGSYNLGIACYMIVQMLIVSGVFTYLLSFLRKKKVSGALRFMALIYFAFFPVIVMFVLCSCKDTYFTAALLLLLVCMVEMSIRTESFFHSKLQMALFIFSALAMALFRRNGIYALAVMTPVLLIYFRKYLRKMGILLAVTFIAFFLINEMLILALHADDSENQEILTVPIQQLARAYNLQKEVFDEGDINTLHEILPEDALALYTPKLSDPVKYYFQNDAYVADKLKYIQLWAKIGLRKPLTYINAWLMTSYGFWYPDTVIDVYYGNCCSTFTYQDSSYFEYETSQPGVRESKIPWLDEVYRRMSLEVVKEKIPAVSMLFSPGFMFWFYAFAFSYALYRRKYHILIPYLMILFVWLTLLLGPTYLIRYVLILWFALPIFVAIMFEEKRFKNE